jgi:uncharacterized protein (TIRG00374 family)
MSKWRSVFTPVLKWSFAAAVLFALIKSDKLSLSDIRIFLETPSAAASAFGITLWVYLLCFFRWQKLLESQEIYISFSKVLQLGMLGQFFSTFMPGTVGGDLVKAVYIARRFPNSKARSVSTVIVDRVVGLSAIVVMAAIAYLVGRPYLQASSATTLSMIDTLGVGLCFGAVLILGGLFFLPQIGRRLPAEIPQVILQYLPLKNTLNSFYVAGKSYESKPLQLWFALGLSIISMALNVLIFFIVAYTVFGPPPWNSLDTVLFAMGTLVGMAVMAVPVAPLGLGVGQVAFAALFHAMGAPSASFGTAVVTGGQLVALSANLLGAVFFATYRHETHEVV